MEQKNIEMLARWWNVLNLWKWPEDMPGKPEGFDAAPEVAESDDFMDKLKTKYMMISHYLREIESVIGMKECLRYHHLHNLNKTNEEFEMWWDMNGNWMKIGK